MQTREKNVSFHRMCRSKNIDLNLNHIFQSPLVSTCSDDCTDYHEYYSYGKERHT